MIYFAKTNSFEESTLINKIYSETHIPDGTIVFNDYKVKNGFVFTWMLGERKYDTIVISYPCNATSTTPLTFSISHTLDEYADFINENKIEKAVIVAEKIDFITMFPSLKDLRIVFPDSIKDSFDFSPLYEMPQIRQLICSVYGEKEKYFTLLDCSKIKGLESIFIKNVNYKNFNLVTTLKNLGLTNFNDSDLSNAFSSLILDTLSITSSKIKTLEGIDKSRNMQCLYLYYNRSLRDISALRKVKGTLRALEIECCPKIESFDVLSELENLEYLSIKGSNELPSFDFIKKMKNLKTLIFDINVKDGDLTPLLNLSYARSIKNRKHYNLKDNHLPKNQYFRGNENIEEWRRI